MGLEDKKEGQTLLLPWLQNYSWTIGEIHQRFLKCSKCKAYSKYHRSNFHFVQIEDSRRLTYTCDFLARKGKLPTNLKSQHKFGKCSKLEVHSWFYGFGSHIGLSYNIRCIVVTIAQSQTLRLCFHLDPSVSVAGRSFRTFMVIMRARFVGSCRNDFLVIAAWYFAMNWSHEYTRKSPYACIFWCPELSRRFIDRKCSTYAEIFQQNKVVWRFEHRYCSCFLIATAVGGF